MHERERWEAELQYYRQGRVWKDHMEKIMNEENEWDHMMEVNVWKDQLRRLPGKR